MRRLALTLAAVLALASCGGGGRNDADVAFAQEMIPHHEQAVVMTDLVDDADASREVRAVAEQIRDAQQPEITRMRQWLVDWDAGDSAAMDGSMEGPMNGMASKADLEELAQLTGEAFDQRFLALMTAHHEGAVEMARTELADGQDPDARELARSIIRTQQDEIDEMTQLSEERR